MILFTELGLQIAKGVIITLLIILAVSLVLCAYYGSDLSEP